MKMIDILLNEHRKMYNRMYLHYFSIDVENFLAYKGIKFVYIEMTEDE